jgi:hypothetical protein
MNLARRGELAFIETPIAAQRRGRRKDSWRLFGPRARMARAESQAGSRGRPRAGVGNRLVQLSERVGYCRPLSPRAALIFG